MLERFVAGAVRGAFGLKGRVKVQSYSGEIDHLEELETVVLRNGPTERTMTVEETGGAPSSFYMKFKGVDTPEAAKLLNGWELLVSRDEAAYLDEDEYYVEDLKGLAVLLDGRRIGEIADVVEGGGGQLMEVRLDAGETRLVPFRREFFGEIDFDRRETALLAGWILE